VKQMFSRSASPSEEGFNFLDFGERLMAGSILQCATRKRQAFLHGFPKEPLTFNVKITFNDM
jgi:hypothetical protein